MMEPVEHPTGISLKAAYLLLKEMKQPLEPPTIDRVALLLDNVLHFGWLVRALHDEAENARLGLGDSPETSNEILEFDDWAGQNLF